MWKNWRVLGWCLFALVLVAPRPVLAQAVGAIVGTVSDPSGSLIPHARVTATRIDTQVSQSTVTTSAGTYAIPNLPVGTYVVTVESAGFQVGTVRESLWT